MTRYLRQPHLHPSSLQRVAARDNTWRMEGCIFGWGKIFFGKNPKFGKKSHLWKILPIGFFWKFPIFFGKEKFLPKLLVEVLNFLEIGKKFSSNSSVEIFWERHLRGVFWGEKSGVPSLKLTAILPLKIDHWKRKFLLETTIFRGELLVSGRVSSQHLLETKNTKKKP